MPPCQWTAYLLASPMAVPAAHVAPYGLGGAQPQWTRSHVSWESHSDSCFSKPTCARRSGGGCRHWARPLRLRDRPAAPSAAAERGARRSDLGQRGRCGAWTPLQRLGTEPSAAAAASSSGLPRVPRPGPSMPGHRGLDGQLLHRVALLTRGRLLLRGRDAVGLLQA